MASCVHWNCVLILHWIDSIHGILEGMWDLLVGWQQLIFFLSHFQISSDCLVSNFIHFLVCLLSSPAFFSFLFHFIVNALRVRLAGSRKDNCVSNIMRADIA